MAEYSRMAKGSFTATGTSQVINLPFVPDFVEVWNYSIIKTATANRVARAWWDNKLVDPAQTPPSNPTMVEIYNNGSAVVFDTIQTNGISTFSGGLMLQYGPVYQHSASTDFSIAVSGAGGAGPATTVTTTTAHGLNTGDVVIFSNLAQSSTTGMQQIAGIPFVVTVTSSTVFTIFWDTSGSNYTAFNTATSTGNVGSFKKVLYPNLYLPGENIVAAVTLGATTTIKTTAQHNFHVGQEIAFRIPSVWGPYQLNSLPNTMIPGSPIYGYVVSVTDFQTFVVNINSIGYAAFNANQPFANFRGQQFPQVLAVGDVNSGGKSISSGSQLYPPPVYSYASLDDSSTINGPAITGAYINNTRQGFVIGSGITNIDANSASTIIANTNIVLWHAYLHDYGNP